MPGLKLDIATQCLDRAMVRAKQDFNRPICVAVCDPQGFLLAFLRMEGAPVRSIQISQGKAYTAARMGVSTEAVLARLKKEGIEIGYFCDPLLTALPGGERAQGWIGYGRWCDRRQRIDVGRGSGDNRQHRRVCPFGL